MTLSGKSVIVVVLAWNHVEDTLECLNSVIKSQYAPMKILLVDNASTDQTATIVKTKFPEVEIISSATNLGVSGGYNLGIQKALELSAEYIVISNNDIEVSPDMLGNLVEHLEENPQIGMGMPKIFHYFGDRSLLWCTGAHWRIFPPMVKMDGFGVPDSLSFASPKTIEFAPSCVLILKRAAVEKVGLFDTKFFFYNDDWDYCLRFRRADYTIRFVPNAILWHKVSLSTQKSAKPAIWWNYYGRSTWRFYMKHFNKFQLVLFSIWFFIRETIKGNYQNTIPFLHGLIAENKSGL